MELQREAKALGDPTRHALFRYIADAPGPVGVAELTAFARLNHNAVRQHLSILRDAGLVSEETERRDRPGRPRLLYRLRPEAAGAWGTPGPYQFLAGVLSEAVAEGLTARQVGRRAGLRQAAEDGLVPDGADRGAKAIDAFDAIDEDLARRGFRPTRSSRGSRIDFVLERCPFEDVASTRPDTICQLHLGLAEGMAAGLGGVEVDRLVAKDPHRAGCRLSLREVDGGPDPADP